MPRMDIAATFLREEIYGWFHNGKPEGPDRVQFLHKNKAELHVDWLKEPHQSWRAMVGYLQKCRGRGFWSLEAVCDGQDDNLISERTMFDGRREHALVSAKHEGTPLKRTTLLESVFAFSSAELTHLQWLMVSEFLRFMLICDTAAKWSSGAQGRSSLWMANASSTPTRCS